MNEAVSQPNRPRSFILRLLLDEQGALHGQISEPGSRDEWRATFVELAGLSVVLQERLGQKASKGGRSPDTGAEQ